MPSCKYYRGADNEYISNNLYHTEVSMLCTISEPKHQVHAHNSTGLRPSQSE